MKTKFALILLTACIVMAGCSKGAETDDEKVTAVVHEDDKNSGEKEMDDKKTGTETFTAGSQATTPEELAQLSPGTLTKDFTIEQETSMWSKREVPSEIRENFLTEMKSITESTKDPKELHGALIHLLGGAKYGELVQPLIDFSPSFKEPILPEPREIQGDEAQKSIPTNGIILLDASSSMLLQADGKLKMDTAKSAVKGFASMMGKESDLSLYVYGHAGTQNKSDKPLSCGTIDEIYPLASYDEKKFDEAVDQVKASGWTPLAGAIKQARLDHEGTEADITLYIVSDGAETCDGDPIVEAKSFAELAEDRHVNVIGFQVDQTAEDQLKKVAEAGNGTYMAADSLEEMTSNIAKVWLPSDLDLATLVYQKPVGWPEAMAYETVRRTSDKITFAINTESDRFAGATSILEKDELIDEQTAQELLDIIENTRTKYRDMMDAKKEEKRSLIQNEVDRITTLVDDYKIRMENLKKEQGK
ncbi:VWA domain-containing protein [Sporosarcina sp. D27]|uniref:vWA domain-containing protein n=1 Tax=Sporosarcina sp. D27 TaxID=1382305 RepID=UPI0004704C9A|nr:VWA domain-containing protein [Sporosarcina sp. D27]